MTLFRAIVFAAVLTGLAAGLVVTLLQQMGTQPLILAAEIHEQAGAAAAAHDHGSPPAAWAPEDGLERTGYTVLANLLTGVAFALLLVSGYALRGQPVGWREGLFWGLAGFAAFSLAPFLGLPPELPGTPSAPLDARQAWWLATVVTTAAGLALLAFRRTPAGAALGLLLLVAPHLIGAPLPPNEPSVVPEALAHRFIVAATVTSFLFWAFLGVLGALLFQRLAPGDTPAHASPPLEALPR